MANDIHTMGTKLYHVVDAEDVPVANVYNIGEFGREATEIDTTDFDSPGGYKESIPGLKDGGEVDFEFNAKDSATLTTFDELFEAQSVEAWKIVAVNGDAYTFDGWVKMIKEGPATTDGKRTGKGKIRVSGKPLFTTAEVSA